MRLTTSISVLCSFCLVFVIVVSTAHAQVIYVSQGTTGDGSSWQNATGDLRSALNSATAGSEVWISGGTYTPTKCSPCTFGDRDERFVLPKGVKLRGGFLGTEASPADRVAPQAGNQVILSGQIETGVDSTRSFTVLSSIAPIPGTLVEDITFLYGLANDTTRGSSNRGASGALMYVTTLDTLQPIVLQIARCSFDASHAIGYGGGVFVDADFSKRSYVTIENCHFSSNTADLGGGGLTITSSFRGIDSSVVSNSVFTSNFAGIEGGGGILTRAAEGGRSRAIFNNTSFIDNSTITGDGGGLRLYGKGGDCSPQLSACTFISNEGHFGGALNIDAGYGGLAQTDISDCEFRENESTNAGGAIYVSAVFGGVADYKIYNSRFEDNLSGESGGAILINAIEGSSRPLYRGCIFKHNTATLYGGAVYNLGKSGVCSPTFINCLITENHASSAGGVYCLGSEGGESNPLILNCIFNGNEALVGGALYSNANDSTGSAEPFVANTVFFNNSAGNGRTFRIIYGRPHLLNCFFDEVDCASLNSGFGGAPVCLGGNIFNTQQLIFDSLNVQNSFAPLAGGPLVNGGNDSVLVSNQVFRDLANEARFRGTAVDIGAFENTSDPILFEFSVDSTEVSACQGAEINLNASIDSPYPATQISWVIDGDTVRQGPTFSISELNESQTIQVAGTVMDESRTTEVVVTAIPTINTSLTVDTSLLPDTLCIDSLYSLEALINAPGGDYSVQWKDANDAVLSDSKDIFFTPTVGSSLPQKVVAEFTGDCLDTFSRIETFLFEVGNCMVSNSNEAVDFKELTIYPNPVKDVFTIQGLSENGQYEIEIYSSTGQSVYSGTMSASSTTHTVYTLPQGLYALIVRDKQTFFRTFLEKF